MAARAEHFPFSLVPVMRWLLVPSTGCAALLAAAARLVRLSQEPTMGSMSSEWLREHLSSTPDRLD
jgi:hypothetical protein